jgi:hypothetical protein
MSIEYKKSTPVKLRDVGKDEKWLQDLINNDTSVLGLGELTVIERERMQYPGGRIDFLMFNPEDDVRYEIEIMLGTLDESHIIRTIEYWDIERRQNPSYEHRAVIVAEDITNRFFNIIGLMNKAIPIIAIQLNAFVLDNQLTLNFVKILDLAVTFEEEETGVQERADRKYWDARANPISMELFDSMVRQVRSISEPRITYNKGHIAIGTSGRNFMWCHPRKGQYLFLEIRVGEDRDTMIEKFIEQGIECTKHIQPMIIKIQLTKKELAENQELVQEAVGIAESHSRL